MSARPVEDLGPFHNRPDEWALYKPFVGTSMLELGGKINAPFTYKAYFESWGYRHISVDWNGDHGAIKRDLREPLRLGTFDLVSNIGTSEHVQGQRGVWRNIIEAMHIGSVLVSTTPKPGDWMWHGWHHPQLGFYDELATLNGLLIQRLYETGVAPRRMIFCRAVRFEEKPFVMPDARHMHYNAEAMR